LGALTLTFNPVVINEYLAGDNGILILVGTTVAAVCLGRKVNRDLRSKHDVEKASSMLDPRKGQQPSA
jgi:hypothetical protein